MIKRGPIRICHLVSGDAWGGAEAVVWNLLNMQARRADLEVSLIILNDGRLERLAREAGIRVRLIRERGRTLWNLLREVDLSLSEIAPTVVHTHRYKENLLSYLLAWRHGAASVVTLHGYTEQYSSLLVRAKFGLMRAISYRIAWLVGAYFVAVSEEMRVLHRRSSKRCVVIHNGIQVPDSLPKTDPIPVETVPNAPVIGWVGRMVPVKGLATLLDAVAQIPTGPQQPCLLLVGDGSERPALEIRAQRLGIAGRVRFVGFVHNLRPYFDRMDIFALPSLHEGIPIALLEAMGAGIPVVAAKVGGIPEIIGDSEAACLIDSRSPKVWVTILTDLICNPGKARAIGERGRRLVLKHFSLETMAVRYAEVYCRASGKEVIDSA